uniref:RING-type E3 ubiquitin transferase n=1 Tax=Hyaloperonospora arabidopsidis (strain Emoy2) TaxID=559515 RepID=M4BJF0_HYAAE
MQNHSECPVCKAGISEENVIPVYARGAEAVDSQTYQQLSDRGIPHRPRGQRPDAEQLRRRRPFNQPPAPGVNNEDGTPQTTQEARQQMQQAFLSRLLLLIGILVILCVITF